MSKYTPHTRHITAVFRSATAEQIASALDWYADAHTVATALAVKNGLTLSASAGIIAALSPMQSWGANVNLAARFMSTPGGLTSGYLGANLAKAREILNGADAGKILTSPKVGAFYAGILHAGQTDTVCVDRHAYDIAVNRRLNDDTRPKMTKGQYAAIADMYKRAASILSRETEQVMSAAQVQAVCWVVWRARYWAPGAFDKHSV
jgi:hypothetical protein